MGISKTFKLQESSGGISVEVGSHIGLLLGIVHLGMQKSVYMGVESIINQIFMQFELQDVLSKEGQPLTFGKIGKYSMFERSTLTKLVKALGVKDLKAGVDFDTLVGKPVLLNVELNDAGTKTTIKSFSPLPAALKKEVKPLMNTPRLFLDVDSISDGQLKELPEWVQKIISGRIRSAHDESGSSPVDL